LKYLKIVTREIRNLVPILVSHNRIDLNDLGRNFYNLVILWSRRRVRLLSKTHSGKRKK